MKKLFRLFVLCCMLSLALGARAMALDHTMLKVGLRYGSDAMFSANLWNDGDEAAGSGYDIGYYDSAREFVPLGFTAEEKITVSADATLYLSGGTCYAARPSGGAEVIGGYHLQLEATFETYEDAAAVAALYDGGFVAFRSDGIRVRVGSYATADEAQEALWAWSDGVYTAAVAAPSSTGVTVTKYAAAKVLFQFDFGGLRSLGVRPRSIDGERTKSWFRNYLYFGGFEYQRTTGGSLSVINVVDIEDYVKCVITREMSADWPLEALKAQAVCARTYAAAQQRHKTSGFDVCTTEDCQVYYGSSECTEHSDRAVDETAGMFLCYEGQPVTTAVYYSYNGGASEDCKNVWYSEIPYLKGKEDPFEADIVSKIRSYYWSVTFTADELTAILNSKLSEDKRIGRVKNVYVSEFTETGNVLSVTFVGTTGTYTAKRETCRTIFNGIISGKSVRSMRFTIDSGIDEKCYVNSAEAELGSIGGAYVISGSGDVTRYTGTSDETYVMTGNGVEVLRKRPEGELLAFTVRGSGHGHNVGMSQWGAYAMAQRGYDYVDILTFYYTGVTVE